MGEKLVKVKRLLQMVVKENGQSIKLGIKAVINHVTERSEDISLGSAALREIFRKING